MSTLSLSDQENLHLQELRQHAEQGQVYKALIFEGFQTYQVAGMDGGKVHLKPHYWHLCSEIVAYDSCL